MSLDDRVKPAEGLKELRSGCAWRPLRSPPLLPVTKEWPDPALQRPSIIALTHCIVELPVGKPKTRIVSVQARRSRSLSCVGRSEGVCLAVQVQPIDELLAVPLMSRSPVGTLLDPS